MADIAKLREIAEVYGVAVRAGLITPCLNDENEFRALLGFGAAPDVVIKDWSDSDGVRRPITLQRPSAAEELPEGAKDENGSIIGEDGQPKTADSEV